MKRLALALAIGAALTVLPWIVRPLLGDRAAILWLPGFAATSHWFPRGLYAPNADTAKVVGCLANVVIWAVVIWAISYSVIAGASLRTIAGKRRE